MPRSCYGDVPVSGGAGCEIYAIHMREGNQLSAVCIEGFEAARAALQAADSLVALLHVADRATGWDLIACTDGVGLNALRACKLITAVEPGDVLTIGDRIWFLASLWRAAPEAAPAELRDKPCPVCGGPLGAAPVVQCACGRWSHLENSAVPDDPNSLNCFLQADVCGECGRRASLEPQIIPDIPASLVAADFDADG